MTHGSDANRQINAHLVAAQRHIERGEDAKAEQHLVAATQTSEVNGIPHFGRYTLSAMQARGGVRAQSDHERKLKNREIPL
jgi:hypothetical protein